LQDRADVPSGEGVDFLTHACNGCRDFGMVSSGRVGSRVVYIGANGATLFVRPLDQLEAAPLVHGGAPRDPFVSPNGQWVGFFDGPFTMKKVAMTGGPAASRIISP
jgi:hypothetical protein